MPYGVSTPTSVAVDSSGGLVFAAVGYTNGGQAGDGVSVVSVANNTVVRTIPAFNANFAEGVAFNPSNDVAYLVNGCTAIAPSYHVCSGSGDLVAIDTKTMSVIANVSQTEPWGVAVNPTTNMIYVVNGIGCCDSKYSQSLGVIEGSTYRVVASISIGGTSAGAAVAVNPVTNRVYVVGEDSGLTVINGSSNRVLTTVAVGSTPAAVAVNTNTNTVYVANYGSNSVSVINGTTNRVTSTIQVGKNPYGIAVNPNNNGIYVTDSSSGTVTIINGVVRKVVENVTLGAGYTPIGIATNSATNLVYVADAGNSKISVISDSCAYSSSTISCANPYSDSVTVKVSPGSLQTTGTFGVSGNVTAATGSVSGTSVNLWVRSPNGTVLYSSQVPVAGSGVRGTYSVSLSAGGSSTWISGFYTVKANYSTLSAQYQPATSTAYLQFSAAQPNMTPEVIQTISNEYGPGECSSSPCMLPFTRPVFSNDTIMAAVGFQCASQCSAFAFSDSAGTTFRTVVASTKISCQPGALYSILGYGPAPKSGNDTVQLSWSGGLSSQTSLDIMEATAAPFLISGTNAGISASPSLNESLFGSTGDVFIEIAAFVSGGSNACNQTAGSSPGWTIWGGINTDYGLYNNKIPSSNFPFPPFSVSSENWVEIGAIFGNFTNPLTTTRTVTSTTIAVSTLTITTTTRSVMTTTETSYVSAAAQTQVSTTTQTLLVSSTAPAITVTASVSATSPLQTTSFALGGLAVGFISLLLALILVLRRQSSRLS
jgi:YVTN family beta-propeller protein